MTQRLLGAFPMPVERDSSQSAGVTCDPHDEWIHHARENIVRGGGEAIAQQHPFQ